MDITKLTNLAVQSIGSAQGTKQEATPEKQLYEVKGQLLTAPEILWQTFGEIYGHKFESNYGSDPNDGWILALSGLQLDMIMSGLSRMANEQKYLEWPPTALVFRSLCFPSAVDLGLPDETDAFSQATRGGQNRHPAVIYTMRSMDSFAFRQMDVKASKAAFGQQYQNTIEFIVNGGTLPEPELSIEELKTPKPSREEGHSLVSKWRDDFEKADSSTGL